MSKKDRKEKQQKEEKVKEAPVFVPSAYPEHAGVLSCLFAGLGQWYNGEKVKAMGLGAVYAVLLIVYYLATKEIIPIPWRIWLIPVLIVWLYGQIDAFVVCYRREKQEKLAFLEKTGEPSNA